MKLAISLFLLFLSYAALAQNTAPGKSYRITSTFSMFPDAERNAHPRIYEGKTYGTEQHYMDSSAYLFIPDYFDKNKPYTYVIWFHGWGNNIDTALAQFSLKQQFYNARLNAIFIFPEGPFNSPDSYGGKFEKPDTFNYFLQDVHSFLIKEKILKEKGIPQIIYAGHSGAYRVISYLLLHASNPCKGIILFDALYGQEEKFAVYLQQHPSTRLLNIYTDTGGTLQNSLDFITDMKAWKWNYIAKEEDDFEITDMKNHRILFLHSRNQHNDVMNYKNNFEKFLKAINL